MENKLNLFHEIKNLNYTNYVFLIFNDYKLEIVIGDM